MSQISKHLGKYLQTKSPCQTAACQLAKRSDQMSRKCVHNCIELYVCAHTYVCVCVCTHLSCTLYLPLTRVKVCACVRFVSRHLGDKVFTRQAAASKLSTVNCAYDSLPLALCHIVYAIYIQYIYMCVTLQHVGYSLPLTLFRRIRIMKKLTLIASERRRQRRLSRGS